MPSKWALYFHLARFVDNMSENRVDVALTSSLYEDVEKQTCLTFMHDHERVYALNI